MNCEEVMELMQRDMDGDLSAEEKKLLNEHVQTCPDCADMLEKLRRLSNELEQLPRVVPKISLVDAILPQLEQLSPEPKPDPADSGDETARPGLPPRRRARTARPGRTLLTRVSGVVALGVVIGLLLVNNPRTWLLPGSEDQASGLSTMDGGYAGSQAGSGTNGESSAAGSADGSEPKSLPKRNVQFPEPIPDVPSAVPSAAPSTAPSAAPAPSSEPSPKTLEKSDEPSDKAPAADPGAGDGSPEPESGPMARGLTAAPSPSSGPDGADAQDGRTQPDREQASPDASNPTDDGAQPGEIQAPAYSLMAEPTEWPSPDGTRKAVVKNGAMLIVKTESGIVEFQSAAREGSVGEVVWSEDSTKLQYTWNNTDGTSVSYVVDVAAGTETPR
jgi:hypothetical protein